MKPIVRSIPLLVFLLTGFPLMAQQVITTVKGEQFNTRVKRIDKEVVRTAGLKGSYSGVQENLPCNYIKDIVFEDGYRLVFQPDGAFSREGLHAAPTVRLKGGIPYAEGVIRLTNEEIGLRLGAERYRLGYQPGRSRTRVGELQILLGGITFITGFLADDKDIVYDRKGMSHVFRKIGLYRSVGTIKEDGRYHFYGSYTPWSVAAEIGGIGVFAGGIANLILGNAAARSAFSSDAYKLPSRSGAQWQFWGGLGLTAAGTGAFVAGTLLLNKGREFDWDLYKDRSDPRNKREGYVSFAGPLLTFGGALAASLGIGMSIPAANRLKAFKEGTSTPAADLRFGPTPDGYYGLTLRF